VAAVSWPPCIEPQARKEEYFGLETEPTSTHLSQLKFQLSAASGCAAPFENETSVTSAVIVATANDRAVTAKERSRSPIGTCHKRGCNRPPSVWSVVCGIRMPGPLLRSHGSVIGDSWMISYQLLSSSLLGTWAHFANGSSRSRLYRTWLRRAGDVQTFNL